MVTKPRIGALVGLLVLLLVVSSCTGGGGGLETAGSGDTEAGAELGQSGAGGNSDLGAEIDASGASGSEPLPGDDLVARRRDLEPEGPALKLGDSVIKTADLDVDVPRDEFGSAVKKAVTVAERFGGYIVSSSMNDRERGFASSTLRVPSERFGAALATLRDLGEVKREEVSGEDASQVFIDLEARLRNYRAQRRAILKLMSGSETVDDTIRSQDQLSEIQLQIERLRGRMRYLDDLVTYSTIFVNMKEKGAPPPAKIGVIQESWDSALDTFMWIIGAVIVAAGFVVPIGMIVALGVLTFRWLRPKLQDRWGAPA